MTRLAAAFAPDPSTGCRALLDRLPQTRGHSTSACASTHHPGDRRASRTRGARRSGGHRGLDSTRRRAVGLPPRARCATRPAGVLRTLLPEHHVRAVGVDPTLEQETGRLAHAAAQRHLALAVLP
jgi:hypothetical protein